MGNQEQHRFVGGSGGQVRLGYLLYLPSGYGGGAQQTWPLILFLHGMGERGDDLEAVKTHGIPKELDRMADFPFIVVSPQCPEDTYWPQETAALTMMLDDVMARYPVDRSRVYLTGLSMGGFGTWALAAIHPERFAAIAPICGGGDPQWASALKDIPVWAFHGAQDDVVPLIRSEEMVRALEQAGSQVRFTIYPELGHDAWTVTYQNPELYAWFLSHRRNDR
ncbi:MAG: prolyl oligopeptidase family serine peptidase [Anaerolineales bacterium]|nr:prolyl oligopeptidase family serine peptidase [Anaerolineales bacterium]